MAQLAGANNRRNSIGRLTKVRFQKKLMPSMPVEGKKLPINLNQFQQAHGFMTPTLKKALRFGSNRLLSRVNLGAPDILFLKEEVEQKTDYSDPDDESLDPQEFTLARKHWPRKK